MPRSYGTDGAQSCTESWQGLGLHDEHARRVEIGVFLADRPTGKAKDCPNTASFGRFGAHFERCRGPMGPTGLKFALKVGRVWICTMTTPDLSRSVSFGPSGPHTGKAKDLSKHGVVMAFGSVFRSLCCAYGTDRAQTCTACWLRLGLPDEHAGLVEISVVRACRPRSLSKHGVVRAFRSAFRTLPRSYGTDGSQICTESWQGLGLHDEHARLVEIGVVRA